MNQAIGMRFVTQGKFAYLDKHNKKTNLSRSKIFDDYTDAIARLSTPEMIYQPNENIMMMDYIPYIQQMISANSKAKAVKTRSKRKRLYLPLSDDSVQVLSCNRPLVDEVCTEDFFFLYTNLLDIFLD